MPNALASQTSPYLRQHAENPVDWLPWGPEALAAARARDVPLVVSIGYSSCHWCHVMEHESFEDPTVAALMNEEFVCVKVDREERPDVDALYMEAVQGMTGHGGWPLNVFLTPEQTPFYGGTYFPPEPRHGMPSWTQVLQAIAETWRENAAEIRAGGERIREQLSRAARMEPSSEPFDTGALDTAVATLRGSFDAVNGGFGGAPKFPQTPVVEFLLRHGEREMSLATLRAMARGGIHDQLGGGFHRYSVDASWTVPHFEKMLYDNALLARAYLHAHRLVDGDGIGEGGVGGGREDHAAHAPARDAEFGGGHHASDSEFGRVCRATLDWALREMRGPEGGFYSALDADSEGVEGRYYVWRAGELKDLLGEDADAAIGWLGLTEQGNFVDPHHPEPGLNVLSSGDDSRRERPPPRPSRQHRPVRRRHQRIRVRLLQDRADRTRPGLDDKRLTSWNALMIAALADAGSVLDEPRYLDAAKQCAEFILRELRDAGRDDADRAPAAHLLRGPCAHRRLPGGLRLPAGGAGRALRSDLRGTLADRGARARRADDRALRRPGARRLLLDARRRRGADRATQGARRLPDPLRRLLGGARAAAARADHRRGILRTPRAGGAAPAARDRPPAPLLVRSPAAGAGAARLASRGARVRGTPRPLRGHRLPPDAAGLTKVASHRPLERHQPTRPPEPL